jgi:hypothetical protein
MENLSPYESKILETITIQLSYPGRPTPILLTSAYRSNGPIPNVPVKQQIERFFASFEDLLHKLSRSRHDSYIFIDSNLDLLNLQSEDSLSYVNAILAHGFIQNVMKATRMQQNSKTLIDQILSSSNSNSIYSGTIVSDISDHFFTFIRPQQPRQKNKEKTATVRSFSETNLNNFKAALGGTDWSDVTNANDANTAYDTFWSTYNELFELTFPKKQIRFNKNVHKRCPFMTAGLLVSRTTKIKLHKIHLTSNSPHATAKYQIFKRIYFKTVRAAKKLYFKNKLQENLKNPRKTWETLNEALGKEKKSSTIDKLNIDGIVSSEPVLIANHFNSFFTKIGSDIANSIPPVQKQPEDYIHYNHVFPDLNLTNTTVEHVSKVIKSLAPKLSCDVYGTSTKMIKFIGDAIASPLSHIFNLSLTTGVFPSKLKKCRVIPIFKHAMIWNVTTIVPYPS